MKLLFLAAAGIVLCLVSSAQAQYRSPQIKAWVAPPGPYPSGSVVGGQVLPYRPSIPVYYPPSYSPRPPCYQPPPYRPYTPSYQPPAYRPSVPSYQPPSYRR